jgi:2-dehydropantoate 2-reductase
MKILIFGAGPLGSLFAARLHEAGHDVSVLARGQRLQDLREHGVVLEDASTGEREVVQVNVVEALAPDDWYDLILVVMRKNQARQILPTLAANKHTPTVLFMMNNAAGPDELVGALGTERVIIGFPLPGGQRVGHVMKVMPAHERRQWTLPVGEVDGRITDRTRRVAEVLESMRGYRVQIRTDMDAWLKYHVALVAVALGPALYATGTDTQRLARTRDALVLGARGLKEALRALRATGVPASPGSLRVLAWLPEPLLVWLLGKFVTIKEFQVSISGHAAAARDELHHLTDEFRMQVKDTGVATPVLDRMYAYFDPQTPLMPDGSSEISMNWRGVWIGGLAALSLVAFLICRRSR